MSEEHIDKVALVRQLPGMDDASPPAVVALAALFDEVDFKDGEYICRQHQEADALWLLARGEVAVSTRDVKGVQTLLATLHPGALFGHVAIFGRSPRTAAAQAVGPVTVLELPRSTVTKLLAEWDFSVASPFRRALIVSICRQLTRVNRTLAELAADPDMPGELERLLLRILAPT